VAPNENLSDSASSPRPPQSWLTRGVLGIGLASLFSDWGHEIGTALLPALLAGLGAPAAALGLVEGVADGLSSFAKAVGGWLADRPALRRPIGVIGYLLTALSTFCFGFVQIWPQVLAARAVGWMGRGIRGPSRDTLMADAVPPESLGRAFGFERAMDTLGAVLGPLTAMVLVTTMSIPHAMRWTLLPGSLAALCFGILAPRAVRHAPPAARHAGFFASFRGLPPRFLSFVAAVFLFGLGDFAPTLLILRAATLFTPRHGAAMAATYSVALYTFHNVCYALSSFPAGALADRGNKRALLAASYFLAAATFVGFWAFPGSVLGLGLLFGLAGVSVAAHETLEKALAADLLPRETRGSGFGALATAKGVGDFFSSSLVGILWSAVSPGAGFAYAAVLTAGGGALLLTARLRE
jgi:MFS family permease